MNKKLKRRAGCLCVVASVYYWSLMRWGTFSPIFVWMYTSLHVAQARGSGQPGRVVVSLTTMPHRISQIEPTLRTLNHQSRKPDAIYLNVPKFNRRTGEAYAIPAWVKQFATVHKTTDYGPATKLFGALEMEKDPKTVIITVDDDKLYPPTLVETLASKFTNGDRVAYGACGWSMMPVPTERGVVPVYVPHMLRGRHGRVIDVLQAVCGNAYRRGYFEDSVQSMQVPRGSPCYTTDDIFISFYLKHVGVRCVLIPDAKQVEPLSRNMAKGDASKSLSSYNLDAMSDKKCRAYMQEHYPPASTLD